MKIFKKNSLLEKFAYFMEVIEKDLSSLEDRVEGLEKKLKELEN